MSKSVFLAIWLSFGFIAPNYSQIRGAFGEVSASGNPLNPTWIDNMWVQSAVGVSIGKYFGLGFEINQLWEKGSKSYYEHMWEGGPFVRVKWYQKENFHLYSEIGFLRGNICLCNADYFFVKKGGTNHLSFTNGFLYRMGQNVFGFVEFTWKYPLTDKNNGFAYLNGSIGVRAYIGEDR